MIEIKNRVAFVVLLSGIYGRSFQMSSGLKGRDLPELVDDIGQLLQDDVDILSVLNRPSDRRTVERAISGFRPMASRTWDTSSDSSLQAEPVET